MSTTPPFQQVLGETEKALNAILDRQLAGPGLTEPQWVTLTLALALGGAVEHDQLVGRVSDALKVGEGRAEVLITDLATDRLLQVGDGETSYVTVTPAGRQLRARIGAAVNEIVDRMWGDLPAEDLATATAVLSTILARANAELAQR